MSSQDLAYSFSEYGIRNTQYALELTRSGVLKNTQYAVFLKNTETLQYVTYSVIARSVSIGFHHVHDIDGRYRPNVPHARALGFLA